MSKYKQLSDQDVVVFSGGESDGEVEIQVARKTRDNAQEEIRKKERLVSESERAEGKSVEGKRRHSDVGDEDGTFVDYEAVLNEVGFGLFHVLVLLANGIAFSSDGVEVLSVSFVIPVLKLPTEFSLTGWQNGLLSSSVFLGMLIGGYSWGGVADVIGRRRSLLMSLTLNGISGLASGFAPNVYVLLLFRFVSGIGVGGSLPVLFPYTSEFIHSQYRGPYLSTLSVFWMVGGLLCGGTAWLLIPLPITGVSIGSLTLHSWRVFLMLSAIPSLLGAMLYIVMPESPRYLLEVGKNEKALRVLSIMYKINHIGTKKKFPVKRIKIKNLHHQYPSNSLLKAGHGRCARHWTMFLSTFLEVFRRTLRLYNKNLIRPTILLMIILFCISYGSYGVTLWYPSYVDQLNKMERQAEIDRLCNQTVANQTLTQTLLTELCPCVNTSYHNTVLNKMTVTSWPAVDTSIRDTLITGGHYTGLVFDNVLLENISIVKATLEQCVFTSGRWSDVRITNTNFSQVVLCDVHIDDGDIIITGSIVDGQRVEDPLAQLTKHGDGSGDCKELRNLTNQTCVDPTPNLLDDYQNSFFITAAPIPGLIVSAFTLYCCWRRSLWLAFVLGLSTISIFLLYIVNSKVISVVVLCVFNGLSFPAWNACHVIIADVYPTSVRTTATGVHLLMARIGAIVGTYMFGQFSYADPTIPIIMVAVVMLIGTFAALPLPRTNRRTALK